ncbi:MAG: hypothetical protein ACQERC_13055 [Bacteroidota bacterium]
MTSLKLENYAKKIKELSRFNKDLRNKIREELFQYDSLQDINYSALKKIYPINKTVRNNEISIENHALKLVQYFGLKNNRAAFYLSFSKNKSDKASQDSATVFFQNYFTQVGSVPKVELEKLRRKIETHLKEMNDLINHYESLPEVKFFLKEGSIKGNTIIHFYKRSLKKRQEIINHYLHTSYDRAIEKCIPDHPVFKVLRAFSIEKDYPYLSWWWELIDKHDYRKIDCYSHRYPNMYLDEFAEFKNLYLNNKPGFYKRVFQKKSTNAIFKNIFKSLGELPIHNTRLQVFKELELLFKKELWMSFYTLGLIQAEGLFTEMIKCAKVTGGSSTFVKKVNQIRSRYYLNQYELDYFEFILPDERNRLAHVGLDENLELEDYKLKSYDILTDLEYITQVFSDMENPLVYVTKILKSPNKGDFSSLESIIAFLKNAEEIKKDHSKTYYEIKEFVRKDLVNDYELIKIIKEVNIQTITNITKIESLLNSDLVGITSLEEIYKMNKAKYNSISKSENYNIKIKNHLTENKDIYDNFFEAFILQDFFFQNHFPENNEFRLTNEFDSYKSNKKKYTKLLDFVKYFDET